MRGEDVGGPVGTGELEVTTVAVDDRVTPPPVAVAGAETSGDFDAPLVELTAAEGAPVELPAAPLAVGARVASGVLDVTAVEDCAAVPATDAVAAADVLAVAVRAALALLGALNVPLAEREAEGVGSSVLTADAVDAVEEVAVEELLEVDVAALVVERDAIVVTLPVIAGLPLLVEVEDTVAVRVALVELDPLATSLLLAMTEIVGEPDC